MARSKSILSIQGTFQGMTHVDSKTYGEHIRAARGTHKIARVNDTLRAVGEQLITANAPAKLIKDAIDPYRHDFYGGQMWQRLVSLFKKQLKLRGRFDFSELRNFEIYKEYPLSRFSIFHTNARFDPNSSSLTVTLNYHKPVFKKVEYLTGYRISVIGLYPVGDKALTEIVRSPVIARSTDHVETLAVAVPVPLEATQALLCIKFEGFEGNELAYGNTTKGMAIANVLQLQDSPSPYMQNKPWH